MKTAFKVWSSMNPKDGFTNRTSIRKIKHLPNPIPTRHPCSTHSAFTIQFNWILRWESAVETSITPNNWFISMNTSRGLLFQGVSHRIFVLLREMLHESKNRNHHRISRSVNRKFIVSCHVLRLLSIHFSAFVHCLFLNTLSFHFFFARAARGVRPLRVRLNSQIVK